jgi:hypothetical protein
LFSVIINNKLGEKVREQGGELAQRKYVGAAFRKAVMRVTEHRPVPGGPRVQAEVARLREAVAAYPWKPRSGTTDRHVLEEHLRIVERTGKLEHDANVRDLAVAVGLDWSTVSRAHERLRKSGWLVLVAGAEQRGFSTSACWKVTCPALGTVQSAQHTPLHLGGMRRMLLSLHNLTMSSDGPGSERTPSGSGRTSTPWHP